MDNDYELLYLAKEEPDIAWGILFKKYYSLILYKSLKYSSSYLTIEDYLNEARLSLYEAMETYQDKNSFITYLKACLDRCLLNYKKSLNRNKYKILNESISIDVEEIGNIVRVDDERYDPEKILLDELNYTELKQKITEELTWKEELIFNLKEQNYSNKEISEITDNNLRSVYNIVNRIQNKVSKIMSN